MADTVVQVQDVLNYLGIDYADNMVTANVTRSISTADAYLKGAVGANYPAEDPRAKELALIFIADLYDNRGMLEAVNKNVRRLVDDFLLQLRLELRRGTNDV
jgi:hypothetical protein